MGIQSPLVSGELGDDAWVAASAKKHVFHFLAKALDIDGRFTRIETLVVGVTVVNLDTSTFQDCPQNVRLGWLGLKGKGFATV